MQPEWQPMSALGQKRTFSAVCVISALIPKADIRIRCPSRRGIYMRTAHFLVLRIAEPSIHFYFAGNAPPSGENKCMAGQSHPAATYCVCAYCGERLERTARAVMAWRQGNQFFCNEFYADGFVPLASGVVQTDQDSLDTTPSRPS